MSLFLSSKWQNLLLLITTKEEKSLDLEIGFYFETSLIPSPSMIKQDISLSLSLMGTFR